MALSESSPLVAIDFVANAQNEWAAVRLRVPAAGADVTLAALFDTPDLLTALAPLDCVLQLDSFDGLTPERLVHMPAGRVLLALPAAVLADAAGAALAQALAAQGYRVLLQRFPEQAVTVPPALRSAWGDCATGAPPPATLPALFGPHLALNVDSVDRFVACENAGFTWFSGAYPFDFARRDVERDGTTRRRLLTLLALLARDADTRELEDQLRQDPALSFHLLKLANSAAFAVNTPITSFGQAIMLLGRRQLQRWLQLLLYTRQQKDGPPNLLLPLAALRGAMLEHLSKCDGADRDVQDLAFMCGAFSLLDRMFDTPMADIIGGLRLPQDMLDALLRREGVLGARLALLETEPDAARLSAAHISTATWWQGMLHAYHWAIQVGRNV